MMWHPFALFGIIAVLLVCSVALRIKTNPSATKLDDGTFVEVFDPDDVQQYYLFPDINNNNEYTLDKSINKISYDNSILSVSSVSIKVTDNQNINTFVFPYEVCQGIVIGKNDEKSSFIIQTAAHCVINHPQFQSKSKHHAVSSLFIYCYAKIYHLSDIMFISLSLFIVICLCAFIYHSKSVTICLIIFAVLFIGVNIINHFMQIELSKNVTNLLPITMDIKYKTNNNHITLSNVCKILYLSLDTMSDYNHAFIDPQVFAKMVQKRGDFAFLECKYNKNVYKLLSKHLTPAYPKIIDIELLTAMRKVKKTGILKFDNINKYAMIGGTFQRLIFNTPNGFIELHRKKICKQYINDCILRTPEIVNNKSDNTNYKMLNELTPWIKQYENESIDHEHQLHSSIGKVEHIHSNHYLIAKFSAIQGWSGSLGIVADTINSVQLLGDNRFFHCMLSRGSLDLSAKYIGSWCMMTTHKQYTRAYYKLTVKKPEYFDLTKMDRTYMKYAKKTSRKGFNPYKKFMSKKNTINNEHTFDVIDKKKQDL